MGEREGRGRGKEGVGELVERGEGGGENGEGESFGGRDKGLVGGGGGGEW